MKVKQEEIDGKNIFGVLNKYGSKLDFRNKKKVIKVIDALRKFALENQREKEKLLFVYGKQAPENWPNAGTLVLEQVLMTREEWSNCVKDFQDIANREIDIEWDRAEVLLTSDEVSTIDLDELISAELFFDLKERDA